MLRTRRAAPIVLALAALWNFSSLLWTRGGLAGPFLVVVLLATLFFGYFAIRAFLQRSSVSFAQGKLVCQTGPLWPRSRFEHDTRDITGFVAEPNPKKGEHGHVVTLVTRGNVRLPLPLSLDGLTLTVRGADTPFSGIAPVEHALYIARQLDEALDIVRHEGGQYRVAPGLDEVPCGAEPEASGESQASGESEASGERSKKHL